MKEINKIIEEFEKDISKHYERLGELDIDLGNLPYSISEVREDLNDLKDKPSEAV